MRALRAMPSRASGSLLVTRRAARPFGSSILGSKAGKSTSSGPIPERESSARQRSAEPRPWRSTSIGLSWSRPAEPGSRRGGIHRMCDRLRPVSFHRLTGGDPRFPQAATSARRKVSIRRRKFSRSVKEFELVPLGDTTDSNELARPAFGEKPGRRSTASPAHPRRFAARAAKKCGRVRHI